MLDLILMLVFLYFFILGVYRGFINLVFKFAGFVSGLFVGSLLYKPFSFFLSKIFSANISVVNFLSFFLIILIVIGFFLIFEKFTKRYIYKKRYVKIGDRVLGGVLGVLIFVFTLFLLQEVKDKNPIANSLISKSQIVSFISKSKNQN